MCVCVCVHVCVSFIPDKQQYLLQSLSHFMQGVPKQVLLSELPKVLQCYPACTFISYVITPLPLCTQLLPLLLESLSSKEVGLIVSTLQGLLSLIQDTPLSVVEHVPTLVPRLLTLAQDKASMVRNCLPTTFRHFTVY